MLLQARQLLQLHPPAQLIRLPEGAPGPMGVRARIVPARPDVPSVAHRAPQEEAWRDLLLVSSRRREQHVMANIREEVEEEEDDEGREALLEEVRRLRHEQTVIGEQLAQMARRLQATERRSDRLMPLIARLDEDPRATSLHLLQQAAEKKLQRMQLPSRDFAFPIAPPLHSAPSPLLALGDTAMSGARVWSGQADVATETHNL
uniref:Uncharacterized protein n=1 Tax=Triticum urartu TaxID=4572 RepID=A0A8R7RH71_TRIUA